MLETKEMLSTAVELWIIEIERSFYFRSEFSTDGLRTLFGV